MGLEVDLSGRTVLVVGGGGGGIGTATCEVAAAAGADIVTLSAVAEHVDDTVARVEAMGRRAAGGVVDVVDADALVDAIGRARTALGTDTVIDGVITVVGGVTFEHWHRLIDYSLDSFDHLMAMNLRYVLVADREVARGLREAGRPGSIVHISSVASHSAPLLAGYGVAKAGVNALTRTMAAEWGRFGIRVNAVAPGTIKTPRAGEDDLEDQVSKTIPAGRRGEPIDIANAAAFLLSDLASYISGQVIDVDGGSGCRSASLDDSDLPTVVTNPRIRERFTPVS